MGGARCETDWQWTRGPKPKLGKHRLQYQVGSSKTELLHSRCEGSESKLTLSSLRSESKSSSSTLDSFASEPKPKRGDEATEAIKSIANKTHFVLLRWIFNIGLDVSWPAKSRQSSYPPSSRTSSCAFGRLVAD
jgi:hypothetical protein